MKRLFAKLKTFFNSIQSKIAFYPTLLATIGFFLASVMLILETYDISNYLTKFLPSLVLQDGQTALTVLSVCIGGLISLMVFSFSMVMLLLSQASSNFSPRILPGLISGKTNQVILGTYLATILYNIFILFSLNPSVSEASLPGVSVLLGIILTIICLCSFIYFTHTISQDIQINNILDSIYSKSKKRLHFIIQKEDSKDKDVIKNFPSTENWYEYTVPLSGYFQNVSETNLSKIAEILNTRFYLTIPKGFFVLQHVPFIKSEKELNEETIKEILSNISFSRSELVADNYILAFKQITEIALKAMSPGINDPGTAINAIDYLTELFSLRMKKEDHGIYILNKKPSLKIATVDFDDLLYTTMASLRTYCKHDPVVVQKLIGMLNYLYEEKSCNDTYNETIKKELETVIEEAKRAFDSEYDINHLKALIAKH